MTALQKILDQYRQAAQTESEKGTYFEELMRCYFQNEASYKGLFDKVWLFADWAIETMNNPKYPLELVLRVITISLKTLEIVRNLPKLNFEELS